MSEMEASSVGAGGGPSSLKGKVRGPPPPHPPHGAQDLDFMSSFQQQQQQGQQQEFTSWRNPPPHEYTTSNFYYSGPAAAAAAGGYSPFSPGDIRDSIAAIWSRTSPSGEGVPLGGAYGQFPPPHPHDGAPFHFNPHGADMSGLFPEQYGFPYGYGYTQWPGGQENGSQARSTNGSYDSAARNNNNAELIMSQLMENTKMSGKGCGKLGPEQQGAYSSKKMSWAKVASQPAKPVGGSNVTHVSGNKGKGVLCPPSLLPPVEGPYAPPPLLSTPPEPLSNGHKPHQRGGGSLPNYGPRGSRGGGLTSPPRSSAVPPENSHPVLESLRSANEYNPKNFDLSPLHARYFVLKSFCEDDIHRSIKFEIWCSTQHGNKRLDAAWNEQVGLGPVYLFFSVNGSGHFCGMAQMLTGVDYSSTSSSVWVQDKFKGQFKVKWIYVKDVPNNQLRHILLENNENKPVTKSRDTQEVPSEKGQMLLKVMNGYKHSTCIFDDFAHYERRQEVEESKKNERQQQQHHDKSSHEKSRDSNNSSARDSRNSSKNNNNNNSSPWEWEIKDMNSSSTAGNAASSNWE